ncbi:MAG: hypothetical protein M1828_004515 [Chrysothrix sp. TS-e1954]|nr:MAG: hypothetical protein M1828_004515 [Chrysothrix sp. TS-e1954]
MAPATFLSLYFGMGHLVLDTVYRLQRLSKRLRKKRGSISTTIGDLNALTNTVLLIVDQALDLDRSNERLVSQIFKTSELILEEIWNIVDYIALPKTDQLRLLPFRPVPARMSDLTQRVEALKLDLSTVVPVGTSVSFSSEINGPRDNQTISAEVQDGVDLGEAYSLVVKIVDEGTRIFGRLWYCLHCQWSASLISEMSEKIDNTHESSLLLQEDSVLSEKTDNTHESSLLLQKVSAPHIVPLQARKTPRPSLDAIIVDLRKKLHDVEAQQRRRRPNASFALGILDRYFHIGFRRFAPSTEDEDRPAIWRCICWHI